jgi:glucokinase
MSQTSQFLLSFDVGGSHATAALIGAKSLELLGIASGSIDSQASSDDVLQGLAAIGKGVLGTPPTPGLLGIGMAMPGPFDYQEGISYIRNLAKYDNLYGVNLRQEMSRRFPSVRPDAVRFVNDAQAALLGEVYCGAAVGMARVMGLTLGTGVGSAFAVNGRIVTSGPGVPADGYVYCLPWGDGITEDAISTRAIQRSYRALTGEQCEVRDLAARARTNDIAMSVWRDLGKTLGLVLLPLAREFRPDIIVLGGAIAQSADLFLSSAENELQGTGASLRVSTLFDRAALFGAAVAWRRP